MTTDTAVPTGTDVPEPEQPQPAAPARRDDELAVVHGDEHEPAHLHEPVSDGPVPSGAAPRPTSLSGGVVASTLPRASSLGAPTRHRPASVTGPPSPVGAAPAPAAGDGATAERDHGPSDPDADRDLDEPAALREPAPLREPRTVTAPPSARGRQLETAGSGGEAPPPGGSASTRGGRPRKDPEGRMALREHLVELRKRVVRAGIAILLGAVVGWFLYLPLIGYMTEPLKALAENTNRDVQINFQNVASSFDLQVKGAIWIGVIVSSPLWIYQLWAFITPGLTKKERRYAVGFVAAAVPLFLGGVLLASLFIPRAVTFFTSFTPESGSNIIDAPTYIGFVMRTVLTFGLAFLLPVVLVALNFAGLLAGASILKAWRWVLVAALTFSAIATPTPDVIAMFVLATPIITLFAVAIVIALLHDRRKAKKAAKAEANPDVPDDEAAPL